MIRPNAISKGPYRVKTAVAPVNEIFETKRNNNSRTSYLTMEGGTAAIKVCDKATSAGEIIISWEKES
jgi:hypothetical protein